MRSYQEVADRVFERGEAIKTEKRRKTKRIIKISTSLAACLVLGVAIWACLGAGIIRKEEQIHSYGEQAEAVTEDYMDTVPDEDTGEKESSEDGDAGSVHGYTDTVENTEDNNGQSDADSSAASEVYSYKENQRTGEVSDETQQTDEVFAAATDDVFRGLENGKALILNGTKIMYSQGEEVPGTEYSVRITVYRDGFPVNDNEFLEEEKTRLLQNGISVELEQNEGAVTFIADMTAEALNNFPCSSEFGYLIDFVGVEED